MKTSEHAPMDRSGWGSGPWDGDPDRAEWRTAAGFPALARRTSTGHWCGYVAVPPGHAQHGKDYDDAPADVHGGLTYACAGHICHVPAPGEPDDVWWFGFDCAHHGDLIPGNPYLRFGTYRTLAYVRAECESLATQLAERAS